MSEANISREKFVIVGADIDKSERVVRENVTFWQDAWRRLKKNKAAMVSLIILALIGVMVIIGPLISGHEYDALNDIGMTKPNAKNWFGTDNLGRDLFTRVWKGGRISLMLGLLGALIDTVVGAIYGGISGYYGGLVDDIMMRIVEILRSIPYMIMVILVSMWVGKGVMALLLAMTLTGWLHMARLVRGQVLQLKEQEYVMAAVALGAKSKRIILKHLIPNTMGVIIVAITFDIPGFIFGEAFLGYIGLGVQSPQTSWGSLAAEAKEVMVFQPTQMLFPALCICLTMLSFQLLGDGLRDALDPKLRN